jgi:hypothetical protein
MALLAEVASFVATAASLSSSLVFQGRLPASPDACVAIHEYPGRPPDHTFGQAAIATEHPRVQVTVRGVPHDYATPRATAETIYRAMAAASAQSSASTRYLTMDPLQPPFLMTRDANERCVLAFNCAVIKELSA